MKIIKKFVCFIVLFTIAFCVSFSWKENRVYAEESSAEDSGCEESPQRGWFVTVNISINGDENTVWTTAKHEFSIFSSTVIVYLYLYCSDTYQESYTNMTLVSSNYSSNLTLGNSITASGSTGGVPKYWLGRMYYKIDNGNWQESVTGAELFG